MLQEKYTQKVLQRFGHRVVLQALAQRVHVALHVNSLQFDNRDVVRHIITNAVADLPEEALPDHLQDRVEQQDHVHQLHGANSSHVPVAELVLVTGHIWCRSHGRHRVLFSRIEVI